jgi:hypothetical protein
VIDPGSSDPPATWRREIAEAGVEIREGTRIAVVSTSVVVRGAVTAIAWMRKPSYTLTMVATLDEAVALAEQSSPGRGALARTLMEDLLARARAEAGGA